MRLFCPTHSQTAGVRRWWAGLSKAYSRKTPSAGTQIEDFKSLGQLLNVWHFIKLNKLQNYIQIKGIKTINTYSAKHLSIAASSTVTQAWGTAVARGLNRGASLAPLHGISRTVDPSFISIPFITLFFFYIHETHCKVYTNSQELYWCSRHFTMNPREPAFSGRMGCLYKPSGVFHFKNTSSPFPNSPWICTCPNHPHFKQAVHTGTPDQHWPAALADGHNVSSALLVNKGIDYQILQRI